MGRVPPQADFLDECLEHPRGRGLDVQFVDGDEAMFISLRHLGKPRLDKPRHQDGAKAAKNHKSAHRQDVSSNSVRG